MDEGEAISAPKPTRKIPDPKTILRERAEDAAGQSLGRCFEVDEDQAAVDAIYGEFEELDFSQFDSSLRLVEIASSDLPEVAWKCWRRREFRPERPV